MLSDLPILLQGLWFLACTLLILYYTKDENVHRYAVRGGERERGYYRILSKNNQSNILWKKTI